MEEIKNVFSQDPVHRWKLRPGSCRSNQEPMAREISGNRGELTNIILLRGHSFKLLSKYDSL